MDICCTLNYYSLKMWQVRKQTDSRHGKTETKMTLDGTNEVYY